MQVLSGYTHSERVSCTVRKTSTYPTEKTHRSRLQLQTMRSENLLTKRTGWLGNKEYDVTFTRMTSQGFRYWVIYQEILQAGLHLNQFTYETNTVTPTNAWTRQHHSYDYRYDSETAEGKLPYPASSRQLASCASISFLSCDLPPKELLHKTKYPDLTHGYSDKLFPAYVCASVGQCVMLSL